MLAADTPKIVVHHNVESSLLFRRSSHEKNPLTRLYLWWQARKLQNYEKKRLTEFDVNIAVSDVDAEALGKLSPRARIQVVPNGTDTEFFKPLEIPRRKEQP